MKFTTTKEAWKDIVHNGTVTNYAISNHGRVKNKLTGFVLKNQLAKNGYHVIYLQINYKKHRVQVHRLVATAFCNTKSSDLTVNHINGIKTDNRACNLEFCTQKYNNEHALVTGLRKMPRGERHYCSKISIEIAKEIKTWLKMGFTKLSISKIYNVPYSTVKSIDYGKSWRWLDAY